MKKSLMPSKRDVSVGGCTGGDRHAAELPISKSKSTPSLVTVLGFDMNDVLFRSNEVGAVQWRDSDGTLVAMLVRLKPDTWGYSRRGDDDWEENLRIYGNADIQ